MRKILRRHRLSTHLRASDIPRWGLSISVALCVWSLATTAHAQQPPPVKATWLSRISDEGADTARPLLGIQAEASGIAGNIAPDIPIPVHGGCAYCAANMFMALEQGGNRKPLRPGIKFQHLSESVKELELITGKNTLLLYMERQEDQLAFLRENLGAGDHAIIAIRVQDLVDGDIRRHGVNVANVDGELLVFDAGAAAKEYPGAEGVPVGDFFANGISSNYRVLAEDFSERSAQVVIRTARDYSLPVNHQVFLSSGGGTKVRAATFSSTPGASRVQISSDDLAAYLKGEAEGERKRLRQQNCAAPI